MCFFPNEICVKIYKSINIDTCSRVTGGEGVRQGRYACLCIMGVCGRVESKCRKNIIFDDSGIGGVIAIEKKITVPANDNVVKIK